MTNLNELHLNARRTRRNVVKMGAILTSAAVASLATVKDGAAEDDNGQGKDKGQHKGEGGDVHCLMRGTTIKTADGDRKIEDLAIGDLLPTMFGGLRRIQWIARYPLKKSDPSKPWVKGVLPVRGFSLGARSGCPAHGSVCDRGTFLVPRRLVGAGREPHQRRVDYA